MPPFQSASATVLGVNGKLAGAAILAVAAYACWPTHPKWWGFGMMSAILALGAVTNVIQAIHLMKKLYIQDKAVAEYEKLGAEQKSAELATDDALRQAGMLDG